MGNPKQEVKIVLRSKETENSGEFFRHRSLCFLFVDDHENDRTNQSSAIISYFVSFLGLTVDGAKLRQKNFLLKIDLHFSPQQRKF